VIHGNDSLRIAENALHDRKTGVFDPTTESRADPSLVALHFSLPSSCCFCVFFDHLAKKLLCGVKNCLRVFGVILR